MIADPENEGRQAAEQFRVDHGLGTQPIGDIITIIGDTVGVDVAVLDVHADEHGMTMRDPQNGAVIIAVARTEHPMRQRSNLAHELAHVVFNDPGRPMAEQDGWGIADETERRARAFARHLLVPQQGLRAMISGQPVDERMLSRIVQRFLVSPAMATIAVGQCTEIPAEAQTRWTEVRSPDLATKYGWADLYAQLRSESLRSRAPQRLLERATRGFQEGVVGVAAIARLRGVDPSSVARDMAEAGIVPAQFEEPDDEVLLEGLSDEELNELFGAGPGPAA